MLGKFLIQFFRELIITNHTSLKSKAIFRAILWNFAGLVIPMLAGIILLPWFIDTLGQERFGLLIIIWMIVGYFSLFDMGLGKALTRLVAVEMGNDKKDNLGELIWTSLFMMVAFGLIGAALIIFGADKLVGSLLDVHPIYREEAVAAFKVLGIGVPFVIATSGMTGLLEAHQKFRTLSIIRIPLGLFTFVGPFVVLQFVDSLIWITTVLVCIRVIVFFVYFFTTSKICPELLSPVFPTSGHIRPLFGFGGWLTISNIVGPMMVYFDRFLVGSVLGMSAVAYYATPQEVLGRVHMLPYAVMGVLFPTMTTVIEQDRARLPILYNQVNIGLVIIILPIMFGVFLFAPEILQLWLGDDFSLVATPVVHWLSLGLLINVMARPALTLLQSAGRSDLGAKTHLSELIPYAVLLYFFTVNYGIVGTAIIWFARVFIDIIILNVLVQKFFKDLSSSVKRTFQGLLILIVVFGLAIMVEAFWMRVILQTVVVLPCILIGSKMISAVLGKKTSSRTTIFRIG